MSSVVLKAQDLTKRYGRLTAVDNLTVEIRQGEILGLLGPNGAGKTTTINMLCGLLAPDSGEVFIQGVPVIGGDVAVHARVGICPQQPIFWEKLTCLEQLEFIGEMYALPRRAARRRAEQLLGIMELAGQRHRLAGTLSGGMQRRLNLALGLVHNPDILVLDEPEAGLDPQSRILVRQYIRSLAPQKTIILTTHNMDEADRMSDRVAIMDHGRLLVLDTPTALKRTVGQGDVLEIEVQGLPPVSALAAVRHSFPAIISALPAEPSGLTPGEPPPRGVLALRGRNILEVIPAIVAVLQDLGAQVGEIHLRANTLEDVFITLTGRSLQP
jgi:ABC-2 type transport system ATP-binding protein